MADFVKVGYPSVQLIIVLLAFSFICSTTAKSVIYEIRPTDVKSKDNRILSSDKKNILQAGSGLHSICVNSTCKLNFNPEDVDKLQFKILEYEALAVFMYLTISNSTLNDKTALDSKGQIRQKWAWISTNPKAKFLATLPYDVDILSLTTLTKDVYTMTVNVNSTPANCYMNLTKQCINYHIAQGLVGSIQNTGHVCYKVEKPIGQNSGYNCCHSDYHSQITCDLPVNSNLWVQYALKLLWFISFAFGILSPLLLKYLPKEFVRRAKPKNRQMRRSDSLYTSYDSSDSAVLVASKILISKGDGLLDIARSTTQSSACSRFTRCLFVVLLSLLPVIQTLLYVFLKKSEVGVSEDVLGLGSAFLTLLNPSGKYAFLGLYCFCIALLAIAMAIPKTLSELARRLSGKKDEQTFLGFQKPEDLVSRSDKRGFQLMYENMVFHLNCLMTVSFWKFAFNVLVYPLYLLCNCNSVDNEALDEEQEDADKLSACGQIIRGLVILLTFPFWIIIITSAFILYILPITYVAFRIWKMLFKYEVECSCCGGIPTAIKILSLPLLYILFIVFCICVEASYLLLVLEISVNLVFLGSVIGFTTMGVLFYIDAYVSYVVIIILGMYYIVASFKELKIGFKQVKVIIFDQCQEHDEELKAEASIRDTFSGQSPLERTSSTSSLQKLSKSISLVTLCDEKNIPSIPLRLFLAAQNKVFPFKRVIISKMLNLFMIFVYLIVVFSFVMSLVEYNAASSFVQALAILFLGSLPLMMKGNYNEIPEKEEKRIKYHVREQINKYCKRFA